MSNIITAAAAGDALPKNFELAVGDVVVIQNCCVKQAIGHFGRITEKDARGKWQVKLIGDGTLATKERDGYHLVARAVPASDDDLMFAYRESMSGVGHV